MPMSIRWWHHPRQGAPYRWKFPTIKNNFWVEIDFGKFSIFLCHGKNWPILTDPSNFE